jgi:hypothetical protein
VSSKNLGLIAVVLSIATISVLYSMRLLPAFLSTVLVAFLVTVSSILAARRGSKLWLLLTLWPVAFAAVLALSSSARINENEKPALGENH